MPLQDLNLNLPGAERLRFNSLIRPLVKKYSQLEAMERVLAKLFLTSGEVPIYFGKEEGTLYLNVDVSNPETSTVTINYEYIKDGKFSRRHPSTYVSTDTYYVYHKLKQKHFENYCAFCRVETYETYYQKPPMVIYFPLEFNELDRVYYHSIEPEIHFNTEQDKKPYDCGYMTEDIYYSNVLYPGLSSSLCIHELDKIEEERHGHKLFRQDITNKQLYFIQLFETYLPYLMLSFIQFDGIVDDIKIKILSKLNFSKHDNVLRVLNYQDHNDIRRILPRLIEKVHMGIGYTFK